MSDARCTMTADCPNKVKYHVLIEPLSSISQETRVVKGVCDQHYAGLNLKCNHSPKTYRVDVQVRVEDGSGWTGGSQVDLCQACRQRLPRV